MRVDIKADTSGGHKMVAIFRDGDKKIRTVRFGQKGADDFTRGATEQQKRSYRARHAKDNLTDKFSPGALAFYVLWSSNSLRQGITNYKKTFGLK